MWVSVRIGASRLRRRQNLEATARKEFAVIQGATLTLLGLIIAFSFSMPVSRYDLRESYEEAGVNAIHTEYVRADLLPAADALKVRALLKQRPRPACFVLRVPAWIVWTRVCDSGGLFLGGCVTGFMG
jgi:hypothetical protein